MPTVSVVIPIYNRAEYVRECLDSLVAQTLSDIEIVCVDDGSTDDTPAVLARYERDDSRVSVVRQDNAGAGAARNAGLARATGTYLAFLDADDTFDPTLLEKMVAACERDTADLAVCGARHFGGRDRTADWLLRIDLLPDRIPFSRRDIPDHILLFTSSVPWNKLFRRSFVIDNGLRFQEIRRANDLYFTGLALVRAGRITIVDEHLVNYRVGQSESPQSANQEAPTDFCRALIALKEALVESGEFAEVERGFVNDAALHCVYNLDSTRSIEAFRELYGQLREVWIGAMGIGGYPEDYYLPGRYTDRFGDLMDVAYDEYLFRDTKRVRRQLSDTRIRLREATAGRRAAETKERRLRRSASYRIGRALTGIPRWFRGTVAASRSRRGR